MGSGPGRRSGREYTPTFRGPGCARRWSLTVVPTPPAAGARRPSAPPEPADPDGRAAPGWLVVTAVAAVVVGTVLRWMADPGLWLDEALGANIADLPLGDLVDALRRDGHPPLYPVLLKGWMGVFGEGDVAARSLSMVLATATLPLAWLAGRRLAGPIAGLVGARAAGTVALRRPLRQRSSHVRAGLAPDGPWGPPRRRGLAAAEPPGGRRRRRRGGRPPAHALLVVVARRVGGRVPGPRRHPPTGAARPGPVACWSRSRSGAWRSCRGSRSSSTR